MKGKKIYRFDYRNMLVNVFSRLIHTIICFITLPRDWEGSDMLCKEIRRYGERFAREADELENKSICIVESTEKGDKLTVQFYYKQRPNGLTKNEIKPVYIKCVDGLCDLINENAPPETKIRSPYKAKKNYL